MLTLDETFDLTGAIILPGNSLCGSSHPGNCINCRYFGEDGCEFICGSSHPDNCINCRYFGEDDCEDRLRAFFAPRDTGTI
ncbi:MAG: hypothetical protein LBS53_08935 [Synergistaceae bacterium]|jgi:hypothetical protein|nr:hypothetical protein [Synergistaceae bacterium]